jgi:hypothetical protein
MSNTGQCGVGEVGLIGRHVSLAAGIFVSLPTQLILFGSEVILCFSICLMGIMTFLDFARVW